MTRSQRAAQNGFPGPQNPQIRSVQIRTVVAEIITELIRLEPDICICTGII